MGDVLEGFAPLTPPVSPLDEGHAPDRSTERRRTVHCTAGARTRLLRSKLLLQQWGLSYAWRVQGESDSTNMVGSWRGRTRQTRAVACTRTLGWCCTPDYRGRSGGRQQPVRRLARPRRRLSLDTNDKRSALSGHVVLTLAWSDLLATNLGGKRHDPSPATHRGER